MVDLWLEAQQKATKQQHFHTINGFLSLQLKLRLKLGFRLRLTNRLGDFIRDYRKLQ